MKWNECRYEQHIYIIGLSWNVDAVLTTHLFTIRNICMNCNRHNRPWFNPRPDLKAMKFMNSSENQTNSISVFEVVFVVQDRERGLIPLVYGSYDDDWRDHGHPFQLPQLGMWNPPDLSIIFPSVSIWQGPQPMFKHTFQPPEFLGPHWCWSPRSAQGTKSSVSAGKMLRVHAMVTSSTRAPNIPGTIGDKLAKYRGKMM